VRNWKQYAIPIVISDEEMKDKKGFDALVEAIKKDIKYYHDRRVRDLQENVFD